MSASSPATSTFAPLRNGLFRALWLAVLVSNVATWMQTVGAQWLLVSLPHASILVALVQTADYLPDMLFGLVGGVLADTFDRRRLLMAVQGFLVVAGAALAALTFAGQMPPALLLTFTFLIGCGSVLTLPAYQSLVPDLVPRAQLHSAAALSSISVNLARAAGPAIAGVVIARTGVGAVFALNTAMYLLFLVVLVAWRPPPGATPEVAERFISALRAGGRYVRYAPVVRRILLRATLFLVPASALWSLLPLIASQRLKQGADGYGLLLGALGVGAIGGAFILPRLRARLSLNALLAVSGIVYAVVLAVVVLMSNSIVILIVLLPAGVAWMAVLSTIKRRAAALPARLGARAGPFRLSNGAVRSARVRCSGVGFRCRPYRNRAHVSDRGADDAGRSGNHPVLASHRHHGHGPELSSILARAKPGYAG
jgi:MFS family permease